MKQQQRLLATLLLTGTLSVTPSKARIIDLLPKPHLVEQGSGTLTLPQAIEIADEHETPALARFVAEFGSTATFTNSATAKIKVNYVAAITGTDDHTMPGYDSEAYRLSVTTDGVTIEAVSQVGVIRAAQTLTQMAEGWGEAGVLKLECATVTDWAAFKVRGYMHDVGRSYISVETLKKHIRLLSRFKVNTFHWHMTENQAWRFEVKNPNYAKLTDAAYMSTTRFPGIFYTQEECREVERYGREYGVTVIPEIDMPGHSEAFEHALGYTMQSEQGTAALKVILSEVVQAFPLAPYIHIGADEKNIDRLEWLTDMVGYVKGTLGRKCVLWNPIRNQAVANTATDMTHMWGTAGRAVSGKYNIDSRYNYTNHFDVYADLVGMYKSNIYYEAKGTTSVAGTISAAWNDRLTPTEDDIVRQNNFYANVIATSVRAWTGGGKRYIDNTTNGGTNGGGGTTLPNEGEEYEDFKSFETRFLFHKAHSLAEEAKLIPYVKQTNVRWLITDAFPNGGNTATVFPPEEQRSATLLPTTFEYNGNTYGTRLATGAGIYLRHTWGQGIINSFYTAPAYNQTAYAWTYVYAPQAMEVGAQIEFYNYSRSEHDAVPTSGWDFYGSRIWLNDMEIPAPTYTNGGKSITNEMPLTNENFSGRPIARLELRQGWNKVFLKLPYKDAQYRLDKWQFTVAFTDTLGVNAVEGLVYSPYQLLDEKATLTEAVVTEAKQVRRQYIGTEVGYYAAESAANLDAVFAEVEPALQDSNLSESERSAQRERLYTALEQFKASLSSASIIQPQEGVWYDLYTPLRANRYAVSQGSGQTVTSADTPSERTAWRFVKRADQTWDIIHSNGSYLSPTASDNTALTTSTAKPSRGWTLRAGATLGSVIITSGEVQLNQTNAGNNWVVFNWGSGSNTTDDGCQYFVRLSTFRDDPLSRTQVAVSEAKKVRNQYVGTEVGFYTEQTASELDALVAEIEGTFANTALTDAERQAQRDRLSTAVEQFRAKLASTAVVQPREGVWYDLYTPLRNNRYATSLGSGQMVTSDESPSERTAWRFVKRADQTWDIIHSNGSYLSPTASNNSALTTIAAAPARGWTLSAAATLGSVIITSGDVELNQTNAGHNWAVFNWGSGINTTDTGCQYHVRLSTYRGTIAGITSVTADTQATICYDLLGRRVKPTSSGVYVVNGRVVVR